jgi:hypothetical protein
MISNYRSQFDRVIRTSSYGELAALQARVIALNEKDAKTARRRPGPASRGCFRPST